MKFLLDQSADARLVAHLRSLGHDVVRIGKEHPPGLPDEQVLALARAEQRILIANDRDFGDLVFRQRHSHTGVIYFRLSTTDLHFLTARLDAVLAEFAGRLGDFLVVTDRTVRIQRAKQP